MPCFLQKPIMCLSFFDPLPANAQATLCETHRCSCHLTFHQDFFPDSLLQTPSLIYSALALKDQESLQKAEHHCSTARKSHFWPHELPDCRKKQSACLLSSELSEPEDICFSKTQ